ncbi:DNA-binding transcriptional regulator, GntR family [Nitratireductor indicus]|nr:DNA-binding transcriptional regulator, GntR family [Nitratireductor indicus]
MTDMASQASEIARRLEDEIVRGERSPGARLDERSLAEHFGVSRTPVREALQWLAAHGLVSQRGRQGARVAELSVPDLLDAFFVIAEMESMAARQAARRILPEQREQLVESHERCAVLVAANDAEGFYVENLRFHALVLEASHNRILKDQMGTVRALTAPYRRYVTHQPGRMKASIVEHGNVVQAILAGDGDVAAEVMRDHVNLLGEGLSDLLHLMASQKGPMLAE